MVKNFRGYFFLPHIVYICIWLLYVSSELRWLIFVKCVFSAVFWDSVISYIELSVPGWSFTVRHTLRAATLSLIVYRFVIVSVFFKKHSPIITEIK